MKNVKFIIAAIIVFSLNIGCKKEKTPEPSSSVLTDNQNNEYYSIWKSIFIESNNMTEDYFNSHVIDYSVSSNDWNGGISFDINYTYKVDWVEIKCNNSFLVKMNSSYDVYRQLNIPRDTFLSKSQIKANIGNDVNSDVGRHNSITALKYKNAHEVLVAARAHSGHDEISLGKSVYYVPGKLPRIDGDPYYMLGGTIDYSQNKCLSGYINLHTGDINILETSCFNN